MNNNELIINEWYRYLIRDCKAIITERVFRSRMELIEGYHELGVRINEENENFKRSDVYGKKIVQTVAQSLDVSIRTIYNALKLVDKYPDLAYLPEGKNISWSKLCRLYLPEDVKNCKHESIEAIEVMKCKHCSKTVVPSQTELSRGKNILLVNSSPQ
jgi:hypothetical protein